MNLFQRKRYKYFYDTHVHTSEASACAKNTGAEMARAAKAAGYTGIIITDHAWNGNTCIDPSLPWETWVEAFCKGYENAKKEGKKSAFPFSSGMSPTLTERNSWFMAWTRSG